MLLPVWLQAGGPNYSGVCGMSYCVFPVYFRPESVCAHTQAKQEGAGEGREQKHPNLPGHLSKIVIVSERFQKRISL